MTESKLAIVTIAPRFRGPPASGNGGYVAGLVASFAPEPVDVRLLKPPPLAVPLDVVATDDGALLLRAGETTIAEGRAIAAPLPAPPRPPSYAEAVDASGRFPAFDDHVFPGCFVCGPARDEGDGLRIFAGALGRAGDASLCAAPWRPDASLAGTRGHVRPEFLWAVLDCPGYVAAAAGRVAVLGSLAAELGRPVAVGEPCVVVGWRIDGEGRRHRAGTAVYGADGECVAHAVATWVELKPGAMPVPAA